MISNESILELVSKDNCRNILIIGCGGCMNESLAYDGDLYLYKKGIEGPYATINELNRIKQFLCNHHYSVEVKWFKAPNDILCTSNIDACKNEMDWNVQPDIILMLSCFSGLLAWKARFPEHNIMCITEAKGGLSYYYKDEDFTGKIVKEKSMITPRK